MGYSGAAGSVMVGVWMGWKVRSGRIGGDLRASRRYNCMLLEGRGLRELFEQREDRQQWGGEQDSVGSPTESPVKAQAPESEYWVVGSQV